jgi:hypothetical protein
LRTKCGAGFVTGFNISPFRTADAHSGKGAQHREHYTLGSLGRYR